MVYRIYADDKLVDCCFDLTVADGKFNSYVKQMNEGYSSGVYMTKARNDQDVENEIRRATL